MGNKEQNKEWYQNNKEAKISKTRARQAERREYVKAYKLSRGCDLCGYDRSSRALQFHHHNDDKVIEIARMCAQGRSVDSIDKEIAKCQLLCANCHAEMHDDTHHSDMG